MSDGKAKRLEEALRANLRRRKAQAAARREAEESPGVRYSGFAVRERGQADENQSE
jgi:hypothetical protein